MLLCFHVVLVNSNCWLQQETLFLDCKVTFCVSERGIPENASVAASFDLFGNSLQ